MGVSLTWIGVHAVTADHARAVLGLAATESMGDFHEFPMADLALPNNWYLLTAKPCEHAICSSPILSKLSAGTSVVACSIEEHVMFASAVLWRDGEEIWSVQHYGGDGGVFDLVVKGSLPDTFQNLRAHYFATQESADDADMNVDYIFD